MLPFHILRRLLAKMAEAPTGSQKIDQSYADKVAWTVEVTGRYMPGVGTCLTQALTARVLLARRGHPALLRIGVVKGEEGQLQAHAWLESGGRVVIGGSELERYVPLVALEGEKP